MNIKFRNIVRFQQKQIPELIIKAQEFLRTIYDKPDFDVEYIFSNNYNRSRYFRNNEKDAKYKKPVVELETTRNEVEFLKKYYPFWYEKLFQF